MKRALQVGFTALGGKIFNCLKSNGVRFWVVLVMMMMSGGMFGQSLWNATGSAGAWLTAGNWTPSGIPGTSGYAQFQSNPSTSPYHVGINMNGSTNNGSNNQAVGAIEVTSRSNVLVIGNSSTAANGILTLNGTTVNSISNVIIRNNTSQLLTMQDIAGSGNKLMGIGLGNSTNNIINIDGTGGITISSIISGTSRSLTKAGIGSGVLTLSGANTYSGNTTILAGTLSLSGSGSIASSPIITVGSGGTFNVTGLTTALSLGASQSLNGAATGSNTTGTITVASTKGITLSAGGLTFGAYGGGSTAPLTVSGASAGALALNSAPVTITTTTALAVGSYTLIAKGGSATGATGTPGTLTVVGSGLAAGTTGALSVVSGQLILTVTSSCSAPTTEATTIGFSSVLTTSADISWTNGNGTKRAVFIKADNTGAPAPVNNTTYTANTVFGAGTQIGTSGWYCVYNGAGTSVSVTGLTHTTNYRGMVVEYDCAAGSEKYLLNATADGNIKNFTTATPSAPTVNISASSLTDFGSICTGSNSTSQTFDVSGINLTNDIIVTAPTAFEVKTGAGAWGTTVTLSPSSGTVSTTTINVRFSPSASGATGSLNITNESTGATTKNVSVSGTGINTPITLGPTTAGNITITTATLGASISNIGCSNATERGIYWSPTNGFADGAGTKFSSMGSFGTGTFTQAVTGLPANTTIYFKAFATNDGGTVYTAQDSFVTLKTEPTNQAGSFACGATTTTTIPLTWTDATGVSVPDGYLIKWSTTSFATIISPVDGIIESSSTSINKAQGVQTHTVTGLTSGTTYYFKIWSFTNSGTVVDYNLVSAPQTSCATLTAPWEDFETGSKSGYAAGNVTCTAGSWNMSDALIGNAGTDRKNGSWSVRMQNAGNITMNFDLTTGLGTVNVLHAKFGSDGNSTWKLEASIDGGSTWTAYVSSTVTTSSTTLTNQSFTVNLSGNVRFRIVKFSGSEKINIDDIYITPFACTPASTNPVGTITGTNPACTSTVLSYGGADSATAYWQTTATGTSVAEPASSTKTVSANGTYYVRTYNGNCWSVSNTSLAVTINAAPAITTPPVNRNIAVGANTTFAVVATGVASYQWQVDTGGGFANLNNVAPYSNTTTATMTITNATLAMNGYLYRCVVTGNSPCGTVDSASGGLTVTNVPPNNATNLIACFNNTSVALSWTAPAAGNTPDGYMIFAIAGTTVPATATPSDASTYTANSNFSTATTVTPSTLGKCVYKGTGTSVLVTGLTNGIAYSFKVVAYIGTSQTGWSNAINTSGSFSLANQTVDIPEVTTLAASQASTQSVLTWTGVSNVGTCGYEYLIVANQGAVSFTPSGDGSSYTASTVYGTANQVVYKGTGTTATITGLTNGLSYCYKVFVRRGTEWSDGTSVCQTPSIVYCNLAATSLTFEYISNVTVGTDINNTTTNPGYSYHTTPVGNTTIGSPTALSIKISKSYAGDLVYAYVDWNQDGDWLDASETISLTYTSAGVGGGGDTFTATGVLTPPIGATLGSTRMRIILHDTTVPNACNGGTTTFDYGEVEDYIINVIAACTPAADPIGTITGTTPACTSTVLTYAAADSANAYWQSTATGISFAEPVSSTTKTVSTSGTHYLRINDGTCWSTNSISYAVVINAATVITVQPASTYAVVGNAATFTVTATGVGLSYQWQEKIGAGAWTNVGTNSTSFTTPTTTLPMDGRLYQVIVSGACGNVTSDSALLTVGMVSLCNPVWEENFDFGCADAAHIPNITSNWTRIAGAISDAKYNSTGGLSYPGYISSGIGGAMEFANGGVDDIRRVFPTISSGPVYTSFLLNLSSNTGTSDDYFISLSDATGNLQARVYVQKVLTQFKLGVGKQNSSVSTAQTVSLDFGTTYLIVLKYDIQNLAGNNDPFQLWALSGTVPSSEVTAGTPISAATSGTDAGNLQGFVLRQTNIPKGFIDGIRIGTSWADVVCSGTPTSKTYTWTGGAGSTLWTAASNWSPAGIPGSIDNVIINAAPTSLLNITDCRKIKDFTLNGTGNFNMSSTGTLTITGNVTTGGTATGTLNCASQVNITSSASQPVPPLNYGNLDILGGTRVFPNGGTIGICSAFAVDPDLYSYTVTGSTVNYFSSATNWVMRPFTYHNLTFSGTGDFSFGYSSPPVNKIVNVLGNYLQTAGTVYLGETNSATATMNIDGNMTLTGGTFEMNYLSGGSGIVNLKGDLSVANLATLTATNATTATFNFTGTGDGLTAATTQSIDVVPSTSARIIFNINNGAYAQLSNHNFNLGVNSTINVNSGGTLDFGFNGSTALYLTGPAFEAKPGSTLKITSPEGITALGTATGNARTTTTRTYATTGVFGDYHYIGNANQDSGSGLPANVRNLTINNTGVSPTNNVALSQDVTVNNTLTMTQGHINVNGKDFTLGTSTSNLGTLSYASGYVKGKMSRWFSGTNPNLLLTTGLFPLGTDEASSKNRFARINYTTAPTAGKLAATLTLVDMNPITPSNVDSNYCPPMNVTQGDDFYWTLTPDATSPLSGGSFTASFTKEGNTPVILTLCDLTLLLKDGIWLSMSNSDILPTTGTVTYYTVSAANLFLFGDYGIGHKKDCLAVKTWSGGAWSGGTPPTATDLMIFDADYDEAGDLVGCECIVNPGKTVTIKSDDTLTLEHGVTISDNDTPLDPLDDGMLIIEDSGSLLQNDESAINTGIATIKRNTKPVFRYDYTYWSSPVKEDPTVFLLGREQTPSTPAVPGLSSGTLFDKYFQWNHGNQAWNVILYGNQAMAAGTGYIVRAPQNYAIEGQSGATAQVYTANFIGVPNNGPVEVSATGDPVIEKWNLIGNPYPSAIDADLFLDLNCDTNQDFFGTLYFWTHNTAVVPNGGTSLYSYNAGDYASYNGTGGTGTTEAAPSSENGGSGEGTINTTIPTKYIASGQSFFIRGKDAVYALATFNNGMRVAGQNNQFFKPAPTEPLNNWDMTGKHRVWLNMKGQVKGFSQTLVGYIENATNGLDNRFDGDSFGGNQVTFYSVLETKKLVIQGRALPFNNQDEVPLGYKTTLNGTLIISIDHYDGLFEGQDVYLEDQLLNIVHDLKASAYSFTSTAGTFNERFVLRYLPAAELGNPDHEAIANGLIVYKNDHTISVKSQLEALEQVTIYDLLGRIVFDKTNIGQTALDIQNVVMNEQPLIVKVKLANGQVVNKKIVY